MKKFQISQVSSSLFSGIVNPIYKQNVSIQTVIDIIHSHSDWHEESPQAFYNLNMFMMLAITHGWEKLAKELTKEFAHLVDYPRLITAMMEHEVPADIVYEFYPYPLFKDADSGWGLQILKYAVRNSEYAEIVADDSSLALGLEKSKVNRLINTTVKEEDKLTNLKYIIANNSEFAEYMTNKIPTDTIAFEKIFPEATDLFIF